MAIPTITPVTKGGGPGPAPDLAVIIPHYNDLNRLTRCLTAITAQDLAGVEVVVADNGSTVPLEAVRAAFPQVRFVTEAQKSAGMARNCGVAATTAPVLAFTDSDCWPADDWIAAARRTGARTDGDIFGGRIDVFDETPAPRSGAEAFEAVFAFDWKSYVETKKFSVTANLVTRRAVFEDTGPFAQAVSEDLDWCLRAGARGWRVVTAPDLRVGHPARADWPALRKKWRRTTQEAWELEGQPARARWVLRALAMPASAVAHLPRLLAHPALKGSGEKLRGGATLFRLRALRMVWMLRLVAGGRI